MLENHKVGPHEPGMPKDFQKLHLEQSRGPHWKGGLVAKVPSSVPIIKMVYVSGTLRANAALHDLFRISHA